MPVIPQAQRNVDLNVVNMPQLEQRQYEQSQKGVVKAIEGAEDAIIDIRDFRQKVEANNYLFERLNAVKAAADEDVDFDPIKHQDEIDKAVNEASNTITGQMAKEEFMATAQRQASAVKWGIRNDMRARELKSIDASINYQGQQIIDNYGSMDDVARASSSMSYRQMLEDGVRRGIYSKGVAEAKFEDFKQKATASQIEYGILNDPQTALAELQKGEEGAYALLPDTKRVDYIKEAENRLEKISNQQKEAIAIAENQREAELIDAKMMEKLTVYDVKKEREANRISAKFADSMIKALERPVKAFTKSKTFNSLAEDILNPKKTEKDLKISLLNKNAIGELSDEDFTILNTFLTNVNKQTIDKALNVKSFFNRLMSWDWSPASKETREEVNTRMFKQYMQRVNNGEDPGKAVSEITNTQLDQHLTEEAQKPNRQYATNPETKQRAYSEDGGITWYDEKTGEQIK